MLGADEELQLSRRWCGHGDVEAARRLVTSHLRLVAKMAIGYRGYGLPVSELISEGNIGMMQAVKRFDPERGSRLATYAKWWIRAAMQAYILGTWSLVKVGTTTTEKRLFFNLRRVESRMQIISDSDMQQTQISKIA
jgi:RNA polymerase sigma-32 factor